MIESLINYFCYVSAEILFYEADFSPLVPLSLSYWLLAGITDADTLRTSLLLAAITGLEFSKLFKRNEDRGL